MRPPQMYLALACLVLSPHVWAQQQSFASRNPPPTDFSVRQLTVNDGFSSGSVLKIVQDRKGFLWFATSDGLCRYDGYTVSTYRSNPHDKNTIPLNVVTAACAARDGRHLWIGTEGAGLVRFNLQTGACRNYQSNNQKRDYNIIQDIYEDEDGTLWLAGGAVYALRFSSDSIQSVRKFIVESSDSSRFWRNNVQTILKDRSGRLWFGTRGGLYFFNHQRDELVRPDGIREIDSISTMCNDTHGDLWIGTMHRGIYRINTTQIKVTARILEHAWVNASLAVDSVTLWFGTQSDGLFAIDSRTGRRTVIDLGNAVPASAQIYAMHKDREGTIWLGTRSDGIVKITPRAQKFVTYRSLTDERPEANMVWSLHQLKDGSIWAGTSTGVKTLDRKSHGLVEHTLSRIRKRQVRAILEDGDAVWFGTLADGLWKWERRRNRWEHFVRDADDPQSIQCLNVYALHKDRKGILWIASNDGGLTKLDATKKVFKNYKLKYLWATAISEDGSGALWLGTWNSGLCRFDPANDSIEYFSLLSTSPTAVAANTVLAIHEQRSDPRVLWLGTNGLGLIQFDTRTGVKTRYTTEDGLPSDFIYGILEDTLGNLWLSSAVGISQFNLTLHAFKNYSVNDGLQGDQFNLGASMVSSGGEFFFGGRFGLNSFVPSYAVSPHPPQVWITSLTVSGEPIAIDETASDHEQLYLSSSARDITFQFVGLHFRETSKNRFAYRMDGLDSHWTGVTGERKAVFPSLRAGEYVFRVKAANSDGVWSEPRRVAVNILKPIWQRWWFLVLAGGMLVGIGFAFYKDRLNRAVEIERTRVQEEQRIRAEFKSDMHDSFAGVIAKLKGLAGDLRQDGDLSEDEKKERLERIAGYSEALLQSYDAIQWGYDQDNQTLFDLVNQLKQYGETLFARQSPRFELASDVRPFIEVKLPMEWRKEILLLFCEAMNNCAKHASKAVWVKLSVTVRDETIEICLIEDGDGFAPNKPERKGGLLNMQKRAAKLNGTLTIESNNGGGVTICFRGKLHQSIV